MTFRKLAKYRVDHAGCTRFCMARSVGHAVAQFRKAFRLTLKTDKDTGG